MIEDIARTATEKMAKSLEVLKENLTKVRTGRAHTGFLDQVEIDYYGSMVPLSQVANVTLADSRTLSVKPYEKNLVATIEKAIRDANLGLNPATNGDLIRVPMPMLTEETRKNMTKLVRSEGEESKIAVRNIRRDANQELKNAARDKTISEDEARRGEDRVQKMTNDYIAQIEKIIAEKEQDLLEI